MSIFRTEITVLISLAVLAYNDLLFDISNFLYFRQSFDFRAKLTDRRITSKRDESEKMLTLFAGYQ